MRARFLIPLMIALQLPLVCPAQDADDKPLVRFGVIADPQYDRDTTSNKLGRHYALAVERIAEAISTFNSRDDLAFTVSLGDIIDRHYEHFEDIKPILAQSRVPIHYVYGNHDYVHPFKASRQKEFFAMVGQDDSYYSFEEGGVRFIVMNDNEVALYSSEVGSIPHEQAKAIYDDAVKKGLRQAKKYNGTVSKKQLKWLDKELKAARGKGQKAVILAHQPIAPDTIHGLVMNYQDVLDVLLKYQGTAVAYFAGHEHKGGKGAVEQLGYITFKGMCEGEQNRYAIVSIYPDRFEVEGFGDQKSRSFRFERP